MPGAKSLFQITTRRTRKTSGHERSLDWAKQIFGNISKGDRSRTRQKKKKRTQVVGVCINNKGKKERKKKHLIRRWCAKTCQDRKGLNHKSRHQTAAKTMGKQDCAWIDVYICIYSRQRALLWFFVFLGTLFVIFMIKVKRAKHQKRKEVV